jgi:hypothetical protein
MLSDSLDGMRAYADLMWREGFRLGRAEGIEEGRRLEGEERDELWHQNAVQLSRGETFAELQRRRSA